MPENIGKGESTSNEVNFLKETKLEKITKFLKYKITVLWHL